MMVRACKLLEINQAALFFNPESPAVITMLPAPHTVISEGQITYVFIEIHSIPPGGLESDIHISIDVTDEGMYIIIIMQNGYMENTPFPR